MIEINVANVITIAVITLLALAGARMLKQMTGLPLPV